MAIRLNGGYVLSFLLRRKDEDIMLVNLTPHQINIVQGSEVCSVPPSGVVARCEQQEKFIGKLEGAIPVTRLAMGEVQDLPEPKHGVTYIVSHIVLQKCPDRKDLVKPGQPVRDAEGKVIGCGCLSVL